MQDTTIDAVNKAADEEAATVLKNFPPEQPKPLERAERVIKAYQDYVSFLGEAEKSSLGMLYAHGWKYPKNIIDKGEEHRAKIKKCMDAYIGVADAKSS